MKWTFGCLLVAACVGCSDDSKDEPGETAPTPPGGQGFYGRTTVYDDTGGGISAASVQVCAGDAATAVTGADVASLTCVQSSSQGNYTLELPTGEFRVCVAGAGNTTVYTCDGCVFTLASGDAIRRDHEAGPGGGLFGGTPCN